MQSSLSSHNTKDLYKSLRKKIKREKKLDRNFSSPLILKIPLNLENTIEIIVQFWCDKLLLNIMFTTLYAVLKKSTYSELLNLNYLIT